MYIDFKMSFDAIVDDTALGNAFLGKRPCFIVVICHLQSQIKTRMGTVFFISGFILGCETKFDPGI